MQAAVRKGVGVNGFFKIIKEVHEYYVDGFLHGSTITPGNDGHSSLYTVTEKDCVCVFSCACGEFCF